MYEVEGTDDGHGNRYCTHGPDPAPAGTDVTDQATTAELLADGAGEAETAAVDCIDGGASGKRIEAIYAVASDRTNRYDSLSALFPVWAARVDEIVHEAAAATGGQRGVRWLTDASCNLIVRNVTLTPSGDGDFGVTMNELKAKNYNRADRKYLVWVDVPNMYCGIGTIYGDSKPGPDNFNNGLAASFARVDAPCWGSNNSVEAHELVHNLGGVQPGAPHGTIGFHCTDEYDRMCYDDDGNGAVTMQYICQTGSLEAYLDCNHDDYFNVTPPQGSWLANNWNVASSGWLVGSGGGTATTTTSTTVAPTTTQPATATDTFSGSLAGKGKNRTVSVTAKAGVLSATVTFAKSNPLAVGTPMLKLDLVNNKNKVVKSVTGASPLTLSQSVAAGPWKVRITRQSHDVSYTLKVTRAV